MTSLPLDPQFLASLHAIKPSSPSAASLSATTIDAFSTVQIAQTTHRTKIVEAWGGRDMFEGKKVVELGCGQGDASVVLAAAISGGDGKGHVVAWDPASPEYGPSTFACLRPLYLFQGSDSPTPIRITPHTQSSSSECSLQPRALSIPLFPPVDAFVIRSPIFP